MRDRGVSRRLACPVCLGVTMQKVSIARDQQRGAEPLVLDHCTRCGGAWFEEGEVAQLARHRRATLRVGTPAMPAAPPCHKCRTPLPRDAERCEACGRQNVLLCPVCSSRMDRAECAGRVLDACGRCRGVWFDHAELDHVWTISVRGATVRWKERHDVAPSSTIGNVGAGLADGLLYSPELVFYGARAAGHVAAAGVEGAGHLVAGAGEAITSGAAAEAASAAVDIAGDAAAGVFEVIAEIIGSIFDGI